MLVSVDHRVGLRRVEIAVAALFSAPLQRPRGGPQQGRGLPCRRRRRVGVAADPNDAIRNAVSALIGGLLFGVVFAVGLGRLDSRMVTPGEVTDRLGLPVLAIVGDRHRVDTSAEARSTLLRSLTGLTDPLGMPSPGTLAVTGPDSTRATRSRVAFAIAGLRAMRGRATLLLQTDLAGSDVARELVGRPGVSDCLADQDGARVLESTFSNGHGLLVSPPGRRRNGVLTFMAKSRVERLFREGVALADLVIVDAPPTDAVEGRIVCGAADRSLIVIEEGDTRAKDAVGTRKGLLEAGATTLGVVLVRDPGGLENLDGFLAGPWTAPPGPRAKPASRCGRGGPSVRTPRG